MAQIGKNVVTHGASGKLGNQVVFRQTGNQTIMAIAPGKRTKPLTDPQLQHLQQFKEAVLYAKSVMDEPDKKAEYKAAAKNGETAYNVAVGDFLKLPEVNELDISQYTGQVGNKIRIRATDNFKLTNVTATIYKADNTILETGPATSNGNGLDWYYIVTHQNSTLSGCKVKVTVTDTPGHKVEMEQML